jgi:hypothetical protein
VIGSNSPNLCYKVQLGSTIINPTIQFTGTDSGHKEYSFSVLAASGTTALINNWIPNHSANSSAAIFANLSTDRTLKIDGGSDILALINGATVTLATGGAEVILRQIYKGVNKDDLVKYLWDVTDLTTWSGDGMKSTQSWTSLNAHAPSTAYPSMLGVDNTFTHVLCDGVEIDISTTVIDQVITTYANMPQWDGAALAINKTGTDLVKSYAMGFKLSNPTVSMNLATNYGQRITWTKNGVLRKLYPTIFNGYSMPAGVTFSWETKYSFGFVPDAYNVLKQYA